MFLQGKTTNFEHFFIEPTGFWGILVIRHRMNANKRGTRSRIKMLITSNYFQIQFEMVPPMGVAGKG